MIPSWIIAILFLLSAAQFAHRGFYEQAFVRLAVAALYLLFTATPTMPLQQSKELSRYFWGLLAGTEVIFFLSYKFIKRV